MITNEEAIALIPSKTVRDYLIKLNWEFKERDKDILYRYLGLKEKLVCYDDYVSVPYPFRSGDIVKEIGKEELGIISRFKDDTSFFNWFKEFNQYDPIDWSDTGFTDIDFLADNGRFYRRHISAIYLEYAEIPKEIIKDIPEGYYRTCIRIASEFIRGTENSMEDLHNCLEAYSRSLLNESSVFVSSYPHT